MIFFTICSRNFTAYAGALCASLRKIYPDCKFYSVLCDDDQDFDDSSLQYPVIKISDLGISNFGEMKTRYNITELNTSLKPFAFHYLFDEHPDEVIVYLDPDILVVSKLEELEASFANGADCVLTPHITEPAEYAEMSDLSFLKYGIYNFGFCALRGSPLTTRLVAWWGRRLQEYCIIDLSRGIFVDQKWGDCFPAFIEKTTILRHQGYNVAYWNLAQRRLQNQNGQWLINGLPLRLFHFSGNRIEDEGVFTRHASQFNVDNYPELTDLLKIYRGEILRNGHAYYSTIPYAFSWSGNAGLNEHTPEHLDRSGGGAQNQPPHLPLERHLSLDQFNLCRESNQGNIAKRREIQQRCIGEGDAFELDGYCIVCRDKRSFITSFMYGSPDPDDSTKMIPNWREHLSCMTCGTINRERAFLHFLEQEIQIPAGSDVYITEQVTKFFEKIRSRWHSLQGSEYVSPDKAPGEIVDGIRHEDIQNLSFPSENFDVILSLDVMEHVPFPERAYAELYRCLRPGGNLVFIAPFDWSRATDKIRAVLNDDGTLEHRLPPEYHGNPMDMESGSLCFRYFSWGVIEDLKNAGFESAEVLSYWSNDLKYFGDPQFIIHARKG